MRSLLPRAALDACLTAWLCVRSRESGPERLVPAATDMKLGLRLAGHGKVFDQCVRTGDE